MQLLPIAPGHYPELSALDARCFKRAEPRSLTNIAIRAGLDPDGCLAGMEDGRMVAYVFCRRFGSVGYLGPLGIEPELQGKGYGRKSSGPASIIWPGIAGSSAWRPSRSGARTSGFITAWDSGPFNRRG